MPRAKKTNPKYSRKIDTVRTYLTALRDAPDEKKSTDTLQHISREHDVPVAKMRQFREGADNALPAILINSWAKLLGSDGDISGIPTSTGPSEGDPYNKAASARDNTRMERYAQYETIDNTRPEASSALDCWADIVCTGGVGDQRRMDFEPDIETKGTRIQAAVREVADRINTYILPPEERMKVVRDMAKFGDQYEQLGVNSDEPGIDRLQNMPIKTMYRNFNDKGTVDPASAFVQRLPGQVRDFQTWPIWKMVNFSNSKSRSRHYGVSIFESCLRTYIQVEAMEAAMVVRRLERAPLRMKHVIDVGFASSETEIAKVKEEYRIKNKKIRTIDRNGMFNLQRINMPSDEDYIVTKRTKESPADIIPIDGDGNISAIVDFIHFFNKWLAGLGPPKAHLGYEADTMRSVVTDLHIVFARKGRRMQMQFIKGLNHLYWVEMILKGIDPSKVKYAIIPPALGTRDELVRANIANAHAQVVNHLASAFAQTGKVPSTKWFLTYMMGVDDETLEKLEFEPVVLTTKGALDKPAGGSSPSGPVTNKEGLEPNHQEAMEMANAAFSNPEISDAVARTRWLFGERAIGMGKAGVMGLVIPQTENPFGTHFKEIVQMLRPEGKRELWDCNEKPEVIETKKAA